MAKKHKMPALQTVAEVIEALGGTKAAAEWADVGMPAVSNWIERQYIPPGWHYRMERELKTRGFSVKPDVFGLREDGSPPRAGVERRVA